MTDLKMFEVDDGGATHWVIAENEAQALQFVLEDYFEHSSEKPEGELLCRLAPDRPIEFVLDEDLMSGTAKMRPEVWVKIFDEPQYLACSEF